LALRPDALRGDAHCVAGVRQAAIARRGNSTRIQNDSDRRKNVSPRRWQAMAGLRNRGGPGGNAAAARRRVRLPARDSDRLSLGGCGRL